MFKRCISSIIILCLMAGYSVSATSQEITESPLALIMPESQNLIKNSSFEQEDMSDWRKSGGLTATRNSGNAHSGLYYVDLNNITETWYTLEQTITIDCAVPYIYSVWLKLPAGSGNKEMNMYGRSSGNYYVMARGSIPADGEWHLVQGVYTFPVKDGKTTMLLDVFVLAAELVPNYYIDDFTVEHVALKNVNITGADEVRLKKPTEEIRKVYSVTAENQLGQPIAATSTVWTAVDADTDMEIEGVTVDNGTLTVKGTVTTEHIKLKASVTAYGDTIVKEKIIKVLPYLDEDAAVSKALDFLTAEKLSTENLSAITKNLTLPTFYEGTEANQDYTVSFIWSSSNPAVVTGSGEVINSAKGDAIVNLSVTATLGETVKTKTFHLTVLKLSNLIRNGDLEDGRGDGWIMVDDGSESILEISKDAKRSGEYGLRLYQCGAEYTLSNMEKERIYYISCYLKGKESAELSVNQGSKQIFTKNEMLSASEFKHIEGLFEFLGGVEDMPALKIMPLAKGEYYVDDLLLKDITEDYMRACQAVQKAEKSKLNADENEAEKLVEELPECSQRDALLKRISEIAEKSDTSGNSGNVGSGRTTHIDISAQSLVSVKEPVKPITKEFIDLKNHWARENIEFLAEKQIVFGDEEGYFYPENAITRAEFAAILNRVLGLNAVENFESFKDISENTWYAGDVAAIAGYGLMQGDQGFFRPDDAITREEMSKTVVLAYESKTGKNITIMEESSFDDEARFSAWAKEYIKKAVALVLINGVGNGLFSPDTYSTRAQASTIVRRLYERMKENV